MAKLWQSLFRSSLPVTRSDEQFFTHNGIAYPIGFSSPGWSKTEDVEASFTGYVQSIYKANGPIFAVILARLMLFTEGRFCWFEVGDDGEDTIPAGRDGLQLLERPWPNGSTGELLARMEQDVSMAGNFYAVREDDRLRRLRPDWLTIVLTAPPADAVESDVQGYWYHPGRSYGSANEPGPADAFYLPDQIAHWSPIPDPEAQYRGMSWLTPVVNEVMADKAATGHKKKFFDNGATLGTVIAAKENLTEKQFQVWRDTILAQHQGVDRAYKPLFLASPVDVTVQGVNLQQLDFKITQGAGETRLCAAGGVPPIIVGLSEGLASATYSNYGMARRKFGDHWARPMWRSAAHALSTIVDPPKEDLRLGVNTSGIAFLREDQKDAAEIANTKATTITMYVREGFTAESAVACVDADDRSLLVHTGMTSVQLQPPMGPDGLPAAEQPLEDTSTDAESLAASIAARHTPHGHPHNQHSHDNGALEDYWTSGPGLARWIEADKPFVALYTQLGEHLGRNAKATAAIWYRKVLGHWPGPGFNADGTPYEEVAASLAARGMKLPEHPCCDWDPEEPDPDPDYHGEPFDEMERAMTPSGAKGGMRLKQYWTRGEGLAKWAGSAHPWTALYKHLNDHMPAGKAKRTAAAWFHSVFGIWPGERKGKNPVGPG